MIVQHFLPQYKHEYRVKNKKEAIITPIIKAKFKAMAVEIKEELSSNGVNEANFYIEGCGLDDGFDRMMTKSEFERLCTPIWDDMIVPINEALRKSGIAKKNIKKVIMVGGCTRIPIVKQRVVEFFDGNESLLSIPEYPE